MKKHPLKLVAVVAVVAVVAEAQVQIMALEKLSPPPPKKSSFFLKKIVLCQRGQNIMNNNFSRTCNFREIL